MNNEEPQYLFEVKTPLGFKVHCTEDYWKFITTEKHPAMVDRLEEVKQTLIDPDEIRQSLSDTDVLLFYRSDESKRKRWTCAVSKRLESEGFLITAYPTDNIKEGERKNMEQVKVFYDPIGNTLTVWFGNPADEDVSEETGEEIILMKNKEGEVIGFEKLNFAKHPGQVNVRFETISMPAGVKAS